MRMDMGMRHTGKVAVVTGGGAGIGEAICRRLAAEGAQVAVLDNSEESAQRVAAAIVREGGTAIPLVADVTDFEALKSAVGCIVAEFGRLDIAVNNAGVGAPFVPLAEHSLDTWSRVIGVNLTGVFNSMKAELPHMLAAGGAVINVASITAMVGVAGIAPYVAAKHGVLGLTRSAALDYGKYGIRVTAVCPTYVRTALTTAELKDEAQWQALDGMHALGRCATPGDVAAMVAFIGSADGAMLTGCAYPVDGGITTP